MRNIVLMAAMVVLICVGCTSREEKYYTCMDTVFLTTKRADGYRFDSPLQADQKVVNYCFDCANYYPSEAAPYIAIGLMDKNRGSDELACESFSLAASLGFPSFYLQFCEQGKPRTLKAYSGVEFDEVNRKAMEETAKGCLQIADDIISNDQLSPSHDDSRYCHLAALIYEDYPAIVRASGIIHYRLGEYERANDAFMKLRRMKSKDYQPSDPVLCANEDMRNKLPGFVEYCDKGPRYYKGTGASKSMCADAELRKSFVSIDRDCRRQEKK